jgi:hypothetical protein
MTIKQEQLNHSASKKLKNCPNGVEPNHNFTSEVDFIKGFGKAHLVFKGSTRQPGSYIMATLLPS